MFSCERNLLISACLAESLAQNRTEKAAQSMTTRLDRQAGAQIWAAVPLLSPRTTAAAHGFPARGRESGT